MALGDALRDVWLSRSYTQLIPTAPSFLTTLCSSTHTYFRNIFALCAMYLLYVQCTWFMRSSFLFVMRSQRVILIGLKANHWGSGSKKPLIITEIMYWKSILKFLLEEGTYFFFFSDKGFIHSIASRILNK